MDERYELAKELFDMGSFLIDDDTEGGDYYEKLIDRAIKVICPDFYDRFDRELGEALEEEEDVE
jgi:hypothetical protein